MKKKILAWLLCAVMVAVILPVTAWADSANPVMTLTTSRAIGSNIMLSLQAKNTEDLAGVWVDLNGNAVKDTGEDAVGLHKSYTIGSQTITIYGKVTLLDCVLADTATALDVSENPYLESLTCRSGSLTALDVTHSTALTKLDVYHNSLTALDVSQNTALTILNVSDNQINALDVSGNIALQTLNCSSNAVTSLNLSANTQLTNLQCANCGLAGLNVSAQTSLTELNCRNNAITLLNLSANTALINLYCTNNALTSLTLPQSTAVKRVECEKNQLTALDVTHNTAMTVLNCAINRLTALDISQNTALMQVKLYCNKIKGAAMTNIVSVLPATTKNYKLYVIDTATSPADGNVALESDVVIATGCGWKVMDWNNGYEQAYAGSTDPAATTFVLSNEEGGLIDKLIAAGYGNASLYQALVNLQDTSGSVISDDFLEALAGNLAGSAIFTQTLNDYAGLNGAVAINTDGTAFTTTTIKGRDYHGDTGYSTYPSNISGEGREIFTYADSAGYYIDAESGGTTYKVFAIGWSAKEAPRLTKLELSGAPPADFKVGDKLDLSELTLKGFDQFNQPYDLTGKPVVWKSADESVAQVEGSKLKALKAGKTNVTATVEDIESNSLTFEVKADIPPPAEVDKLNVTPGDAKLDLSWVDPKDADLDKIRIRWWKTKVEVGETAVDENVYEVKKGVQEYTITGLTNDTEYTVKVTTVDKAGNESKGIEKKGTPTKAPCAPCFIATAAYGSYLDPHVQTLRDFRDNVLGRFSLGKAFVSFYYQNSPPLANFIARHDTLRTAARIILTPVVYFIAYPQISGIIILLFIAGGILFWLRKREAVKA